MRVNLCEKEYKNYGRCLCLDNENIMLFITLDYGPRIIRFSTITGHNVFIEGAPVKNEHEMGTWKLIGGHRLWHAPEKSPRTYMPDTNKLTYEKTAEGVIIKQPEEKWTQMEKEIEVKFTNKKDSVKVIHKIKNNNAWPVEFSVWGISAMDKGGIEIIPQVKEDTGLLPSFSLSIWPYTKLNDKRIKFGEKFITIKQDKGEESPLKLGLPNKNGYASYFVHNSMFLVQYAHEEGKNYPDFGCSYETYTNNHILEMETISPLKMVESFETSIHEEIWTINEECIKDYSDEDSLEKIILSHMYK